MTLHSTPSTMSRRSALAGLGAGSLGLAASHLPRRALAQNGTPVAIETELAVPYGKTDDGVLLLLDVYRPAVGETPRPAVLIFHPGGMMDGDRSWMSAEAQGLAEAGYVAFSVGYRLVTEDGSNHWPAQLDDAQRSVRWVRANSETYGVDPERIGAYGYSAGALLASFLGTRDTRDDSDPELAGISSRVACVVDLVGTMDATWPPFDSEDKARIAVVLGGTPDSPPDGAAYRDFSPIMFLNEKTAPFLILQGGGDTKPKINDSRVMEATMRAHGLEVVYVEVPGIDHYSWGWELSGPWMLAFLGQYLRPTL